MRLMKFLATVLVLGLLSGCYSTGHNFKRPDFTRIKINKTTMGEIVASGEKPDSVSRTERNGKRIERIQYAYFTAEGFATGGGPVGHAASFYFSDGILIGYLYTSSFSDTSTDFDIEKSILIKKGKSTRHDIEEIFGPPVGEMVFPLIDEKKGSQITYRFVGSTGVAGSNGIISKELTIKLNENGTVADFRKSVEKD